MQMVIPEIVGVWPGIRYVASNATTMGVDKANVRTIVHLSPPSSVEAYLQESGRASRDGNGANAWLIWTPDDLVERNKPSDPEGVIRSFCLISDRAWPP